MTEKQRRFVEAFMGEAAGNATEAARLAGYSDPNYGRQLITNSNVLDALTERQENDPAVATRRERQEFWTSVMRGEEQNGNLRPDMKERLKAAELLAKSGGDFVERSEGNLTIRVVREPVELANHARGSANSDDHQKQPR